MRKRRKQTITLPRRDLERILDCAGRDFMVCGILGLADRHRAAHAVARRWTRRLARDQEERR